MTRDRHLFRSSTGFFVLWLAAGCTSTSFSGSSARSSRTTPVKDEASGDATPTKKPPRKGAEEAPPAVELDTASEVPTDADVAAPSESDPSEPHVAVTSEEETISEAFVGEHAVVNRVVDIVFAMDTSGSMGQEKAGLEANMSQFIQTFEIDAKGVDYQVFMIGANFSFPSGSEDVIKVNQSVDSHDALQVLQRFFDGTIASPKPLRPDSIKQIVIVTDDDARGVMSLAFKNFIQNNPILKDKTSVNGFVGVPTSMQANGCELADVGREYIALGSDPEVGGLIQDLCVQDWGQLLKDLASKIINETSKADFPLEHPADASQELIVTVDGVALDSQLFSYDEAQNMIIFTPGNEPPAGAEIIVTYTPKPASI